MGLTRQRSRTDGHSWYLTVLIMSLVFCGLSLLFQFVGFVTPGWVVLSAPAGFTVSAGVWYIQVCKKEVTDDNPKGRWRCVTASMTRIENPFNVAMDHDAEFINMTELQVETTLAFVACIVAVLMSINALVNKTKAPKSYLCWCAGSLIISAGLLLIPICRLLDIINGWDSYITYATPYSIVSSGLGVISALVSAVLNLVAMCMVLWDIRTERRDHSEEHDDLTLHPT